MSTVRNRPVLQMVIFGVVLTAIGITIGLLIPWFPTKASTQAGNIGYPFAARRRLGSALSGPTPAEREAASNPARSRVTLFPVF